MVSQSARIGSAGSKAWRHPRGWENQDRQVPKGWKVNSRILGLKEERERDRKRI